MQASDETAPKKPWHRPTLVVHGDARALTEFQIKGTKPGKGGLGGGPTAS